MYKIPVNGIVIVSRKPCAPCVALENILKKMNKKYQVVDAEKEKLPIVNVPQLYYNGQYKFTGVPDLGTIKRSVK